MRPTQPRSATSTGGAALRVRRRRFTHEKNYGPNCAAGPYPLIKGDSSTGMLSQLAELKGA